MSNQIIIGITGTLGAGKGTISEYLVVNKKFKHYSVSDAIKEEVKKRGLPVNRDTIVATANELRAANSPSYFAEKMYEKAKEEGENAIIESLRTEGEINALREKGNFFLFAVDANQQIRYDRISKRLSEKDDVSFTKFVSDEEREMTSQDPHKQNLSKCISLADYNFMNDGDLAELHKQVDCALEIIGNQPKFSGFTESQDEEEVVGIVSEAASKIIKEAENEIQKGIKEQPKTNNSLDDVPEEPGETSSTVDETTSPEPVDVITKKRTNYISWDEYFMGLAMLSSHRSKDPSTQVGACIVDQHNKIVGIGYNGFPIGCGDDDLPWSRKHSHPNETKYPYVVHAEANAILNSTKDIKGSRIYVDLFPCNECAKLIIQSGIKEIIYLSDKYADTHSVQASKRMLNLAGIRLRQLETKGRNITLNF